jgi:hypothetical protein
MLALKPKADKVVYNVFISVLVVLFHSFTSWDASFCQKISKSLYPSGGRPAIVKTSGTKGASAMSAMPATAGMQATEVMQAAATPATTNN